MNRKVSYKFDESSRIMYKYYYGEITINYICTSWEYAFENKLIPNHAMGFILDYRNATFDLKIKEHTQIANFYKNHLEVFGKCKIAIITNNPKDVVIPILVETRDDGYSSHPFCSLEAAIQWVLS